MMKFLKKNFAVLSAVVLCLALTACGYIFDDTPVVEDDWSESDVVSDSSDISEYVGL